MPDKPKELTPKELLFCEIYLSNRFIGADAYVEAGYKSTEYARQEAYKLTTKPYIRKYLDNAIDALIGDKKGLSRDLVNECKRYAFMSPDTMEIEKVSAKDKKGYIDMLFKYLGLYSEKKEVELSTLDEDGKKTGIKQGLTEEEAKAMFLKLKHEN
jgi:hypothetical protein